MATYQPSPSYAHLAPRPRPTSPPPYTNTYPAITGAAGFLASYYAVPLVIDPEEPVEKDQQVEEKEILSASAFLGHVYDTQQQQQLSSSREAKDDDGENDDTSYVLQDVRSSLFPGQQAFFASLSHTGTGTGTGAGDRGVRGDTTWSAERGWTSPDDTPFSANKAEEQETNDHDNAEHQQQEHDDSLPTPQPARENLPTINTSLDLPYITAQLSESLAALQTQHQMQQLPPAAQETPQGKSTARLVRRESSTHSKASNTSLSLSRQSSVRRGDRAAAAAASAVPGNTETPQQQQQQQQQPQQGDTTPISPASAFLSHFSPPMRASYPQTQQRGTQAIQILQPQQEGGDITMSSDFSLSRIGSPTKYPGTAGGEEHAGLGVGLLHGVGPMGMMLGGSPSEHSDGPAGRSRSFSASMTGTRFFLPPAATTTTHAQSHLAAPTGVNMAMSLSNSSGFSHQSSATSPLAPDAAGAQVLHYTLGKVIGRGGFSTVRLARDDNTGEKYACRIIKRDDLSDQSGSLENFELELEIWRDVSRVRCPAILPLLEQWRDPEGYATYLFSPFMARGSLLDVLRREGGSEETARRWFPGVVRAVKALHRGWRGEDKDGVERQAPGGVLHGDLKLDNFLVGEGEGEIVICDFGLAQRISVGASHTAAGAVVADTSTTATTGDGEERRGRREERRIILHSREASPERTVIPPHHPASAVPASLFSPTPGGSRQPSRSRPRLHSPYVSTTELDFQHHHLHQHQHHAHAHTQHVARPSLPAFPTANQILFGDRHHRSSTSREKEVSPGPPQARRTSRSRSRKPAGASHTIPVQTCFPSASLPYASPELLRAPPSPPDFAQDIWALGIILHALLTSRLPFVDAFDPRLQMKIIRGEWAVPPGLGEEWVECLRGCLEVDPRRRWDVDQLAASDAVQGWQEAGTRKARSKSRSRSRARSRSSAHSRLDVSPTDLLAVGRPAGNRRARSRSRNRTDYFASAATVGSTGHSETPGTPRTGRTRSRSGASMFRDREQASFHHSHYDSPLEPLPEMDAVQQDTTTTTITVPVHQPPSGYSIGRSPGRRRSSQALTHHALATGLAAGIGNRGDIDLDSYPPVHRAPSSSSSSRNMSSSRSRSRDQGTSVRYIPRASPAMVPHTGTGLSTSPIQPLTASMLKPGGDVPGPRTTEGRDPSR
ncbi:hypothetical protein QFC21_000762 [Naganishia friedmannii]|uniref:Uncharacterized protein n=1 Tax=Naganishia friedmannii TaxID=89922 RepID=A0ACC2W9M0_9TREE|nr:hypothetical protein QFC21_000762 [Naganishia friedmannii]